MNVSYLGIPGSNSYSAAKQYFGATAEMVGTKSFLEIFTNVESEITTFGMVPVENSLAGTIGENYDLLNRYHLPVVGEYYLKFENHLLGLSGSNLKTIKKVLSHPQPLAQCNQFFESHSHVEKVAYSDTAAAAQYVAKTGDKTLAAIANRDAASWYGLEILQENIADNVRDNYTRFFVVTKNPSEVEKADKCSIIFSLLHIPGSLVHSLDVLAKHKLNLVKIESRPIPGKPFEYLFYVDFTFQGVDRKQLSMVLDELRTKMESLTVLGIYKSGTIPL